MSTKERREGLAEMLGMIPGRAVWLAEYSPGDGRARYAIVEGNPGYFAGERLAWTGRGLRAAEEVVKAFLAGYHREYDAARGD